MDNNNNTCPKLLAHLSAKTMNLILSGVFHPPPSSIGVSLTIEFNKGDRFKHPNTLPYRPLSPKSIILPPIDPLYCAFDSQYAFMRNIYYYIILYYPATERSFVSSLSFGKCIVCEKGSEVIIGSISDGYSLYAVTWFLSNCVIRQFYLPKNNSQMFPKCMVLPLIAPL